MRTIASPSTRIFHDNATAFDSGKRRALNEGGTSSSKTWSILQLLIFIAQRATKPCLISVVSESFPHLNRGCIRDFRRIIGDAWQDDCWSKSNHIYTFGKGQIEFFSADEPSKLRGGRRQILFINEANNIPYEAFKELDIRTERFTFLDWNPVSEFWAHENLIGQPENEYIHSTYLDAVDVLPPDVVRNIESNRDSDPNWWNIYGLGKLGKIEGLVYPYFDQVDALPAGDVFYGMDFGYSNDPTVLVANVIIGDCLYSDELIYETGLTNDDIARRMGELGILKHDDEIFADCAEPKSIEEIYRFGFNIKPCPKGKDSVEFGHQKVRQFKQHWTKRSINCIKEQRNFRYILDKNEKLTEKTTHIWSHCLIAGTLIKTRRGDIAIENVTTDDYVLTRRGWKKVKQSGLINDSASVYRARFSNNTTLTGTAEHLVYIQSKGFVPLNTLRYGDIILPCEKQSYTMAKNSTDIQNLPTYQTANISRVMLGQNGYIYIGKFGLTLMAKYLPRTISTILTLTHPTTVLKTSPVSPTLDISGGTLLLKSVGLNPHNTPLRYRGSQKNGIIQTRGENGIGNMVSKPIKAASRLIKSVLIAGSHSKTLRDNRQQSSARINANQPIAAKQASTTLPAVAPCVVTNSELINTAIPNAALVYVLDVIVLENKQPVYDLTVDAVPEYFANGILVHNSMDARRYAIDARNERPIVTIENRNYLHRNTNRRAVVGRR